MPSPRRISAGVALGPDAVELMRLVEEDLERHASAINEHHRTTLTIRGLALTAVAALVAGGYASFVAMPDYFAVGVALVFLWADYYYSRLYTGAEQRLPVLESLSAEYRRLLGRAARSQDDIDDFRGDLRTYSARPVAPDSRPRLWPIRSLGRLKVFLPLYGGLALIALVSAWYVETHVKPGTAARGYRNAVVCVGRSPSRQKPATIQILRCRDVTGLTVVP